MIDAETVKYIANLARLELSPGQIESFTNQLGAILDHVEQLNRVDTTDIEPTCFYAPAHDPLREDVVRSSLSTEQLLQNAPLVKKGHFAIPKVIG
ncbi:MAG: Asp-tRNA(Asn)/Glu-tRNA(Gln) amidotransferase subunit GatC [Chitinivibrionales bacterium]|nr:Asp-tRNA(Asn)/Glu-tRNA(Gln) amidotransferase subunit GatC [Chitinivibrionales bacterium]MBD3359061.1 Asp-tRNA(Asn)/Glu-tRNA(Gln) amidotransferase subunit GatC [Chitinivibrionales bacterium]